MSKKTPSLETCKKLKEAGFDVETEKVWCMCHLNKDDSAPYISDRTTAKRVQGISSRRIEILAPAPDMQELWEALPDRIDAKDYPNNLHSPLIAKGFVEYQYLSGMISGATPAEALAQLWLWVKANHPEALAPSSDLDPRPEDVF